MKRPLILLAVSTSAFMMIGVILIAHAQAPGDGSLPPGFQDSGGQTAQPPVQQQMPPEMPHAGDTRMPEAPSGGTAVAGDLYVYDPTGRRDPFRPYRLLRSTGEGEKGEQPLALEPLQTYDLDQMQILGILWDVRQPRALIQDGDGKVHTLVKNTKVGRNNGYVAAIREGEVVVIEAFEDGERIVKRTRLLEFRK